MKRNVAWNKFRTKYKIIINSRTNVQKKLLDIDLNRLRNGTNLITCQSIFMTALVFDIQQKRIRMNQTKFTLYEF